MGSVGSKVFHQKASLKELGINIGNYFEGNAPKASGFDKHSTDDIQIKVPVEKEKDIIFQFKLLDNGKMSIRAYDPNIPEKGKVSVVTDSPSLDKVIQTGNSKDRQNAIVIRELMNKSKSVAESNLPAIANELKRKKYGKQ